MISIFNYNTLRVCLNKETKSIDIKLYRPHYNNAINMEMIIELESVFNWLTGHMEVQSVYLTGEADLFSSGLDKSEIVKMSHDKLRQMLLRIQKITYSLFFLPQTIVVDFKNRAQGVAVEMTAGADIRLAKTKAVILLDHLSKGMIPVSGGIGILGEVISKNFIRSWILSSRPIPEDDLLRSGFIRQLYNKRNPSSRYLKDIAKQSPISRIQCKRVLLESILPEIDRGLKYEQEMATAGLYSGDWKKYLQEDGPYMSPKAFREVIKKQFHLDSEKEV